MTTTDSASSAALVHFSTDRLRVRAFTPADAEAFAAYRADPEVARYQSWSDFSVAEGRALIESMHGIRPGALGQWYQFALEDQDGLLVGDLALKVRDDEPSEAELGFTLATEHQGSGYGTEAVRGLLDYAFGTLNLRRVIAITDALNEPAAALLDRVGMRREAHFVENVFFKGTWGSEFLFAILEHEWEAGTSAALRPGTSTSSPSDTKEFAMTTRPDTHAADPKAEVAR